MKWNNPALLLMTADHVLVETLGGKLREWGAMVLHYDLWSCCSMPATPVEVLLLDVRQQTAEVLRHYKSIRQENLVAETVLINRSGNISASMEGMRAGASDELIVPFDTETLREKINAAFSRSRRFRTKDGRRSLFAIFEQTMSAASFAQVAEFETAIEMVNVSARGGQAKESRGEQEAGGNNENEKENK